MSYTIHNPFVKKEKTMLQKLQDGYEAVVQDIRDNPEEAAELATFVGDVVLKATVAVVVTKAVTSVVSTLWSKAFAN